MFPRGKKMVGRASARITLRADAAPDLIFIRKKENVKYSQKGGIHFAQVELYFSVWKSKSYIQLVG